MGRPPVKNEAEEINLAQKKRLQYLLSRYAPPSLSGMEFFRRLRLADAYDTHDPDRGEQNSEKGFKEKVLGRKKRWLPNAVKANVGQFKQWMQLKGEPNYRPNKGLDRTTCEALGFVIADEFEHWRNGRLSDGEHATASLSLADFISSGAGQPAEIFFGIRPAFAEELTDEKREQRATTDQCQRFLRGGIPFLNVINANATIRRDIESATGSSLADFIKNDPRRMLLITSAAGDGKTTLLYRLARIFYDRHWRVFIKRTNTGSEKFEAPIGRSIDTIVLIDRGEDLGSLDKLSDWLADNPRLHIIVAARDLEWQYRNFPIEDGRFRHLFIDRLSDREASDLAKLMQKFNTLDAPASLDEIRSRLVKTVHESHYPHMLAAVMSAARNKDFSEILESMVERFEPKDIIKLTALGGTMRFEDGRALNCTSNMMWISRAANTESLVTGRERFDAIYKRIRSEIVFVGDSRYDLRHPDISQFVLNKFYHSDDHGTFSDVEALESDLLQFVRIVFRLRILENLPLDRRRTMGRYLYRTPEYWWKSASIQRREIGRRLFEETYNLLGNAQAELSIRATLLQNWMRLESSANDEASIEIRNKWFPALIASLGTLSERNEDTTEAYQHWFQFALEHKSLGNIDLPEAGTARWVLREWWNAAGGKFRGPTLISLRAKYATIGLGEISDPLPNTIRRLFHECWNERIRFGPQYLVTWAEAESASGNVGSSLTNPEPYSARWIYREGWRKEADRDRFCTANFMMHWAGLEAEKGELGATLQTSDDYSARWIFRQAWKKETRAARCSPELIARWAETEAEKGELGTLLQNPEEYSARWIFQQAWKEDNKDGNEDDKLCTADTIRRWAATETQKGEFGSSLKLPEENSARWIFQQAWKEENRDRLCTSQVFINWADTESDPVRGEAGRLDGELEQYSARWILRKAYELGKIGGINLFDVWIKLEMRDKNYGGSANPPSMYSARWALGERAKLKADQELNTVLQAFIASEEGNVGVFDAPEPGTARALFREILRSGRMGHSALKRWARLEYSASDRNFNEGKEYSAEWILKQYKADKHTAEGSMPSSLEEWLIASD